MSAPPDRTAASPSLAAPAATNPNFRLRIVVPTVTLLMAAMIVVAVWLTSVRATEPRTPPATIPLNFVWIPGGDYMVGSTPGERAAAMNYVPPSQEALVKPRIDAELPAETVKLAGFLAATRPVTNREYLDFVQSTGHRTPGLTEAEWAESAVGAEAIGARDDGSYQRYAAPQLWQDGKPPVALLDAPVTMVSLADARAYCDWLSGKLNMSVRLPEECESEALAGPTPFPWGDRWREGVCHAGVGRKLPASVGTLPTGDRWNEVMPVQTKQENYADRTEMNITGYAGQVYEWTSMPDPVHRGFSVLKGGGCWIDLPYDCRRACRRIVADTIRSPFAGFRVVAVP